MKKLYLVLFSVFFLVLALGLYVAKVHAQGIGAQPIVCNKIIASATLTSGTTQLVVGSTGQLIDICGFVFQGIATGTVQLVFGTGTSCTTPTNITSSFVTSATSLAIDHIATAFTSSALGQSLCAVVTGTSSITVGLYYAQP